MPRRRGVRQAVRRPLARAAFAAVVLSAGVVSSAFAADVIPGERWCGVPDGDGSGNSTGTVRDIARIEFEGNRVTRPEVMLREIPQKVGEACSHDAIVDGIQGMMDLDLFRSIRAELALERGADDPSEGALVLRYFVREKIFFLAIPRLSRTSDGELRTGLQLRWDNFSGRLHELRITAERRREDDGRGRSGFVRTLDYSVPRFLGSDWGAGLELALEERQVEFGREGRTFGEGRRDVTRVAIGVSRWLGRSNGVQGWRLRTGVEFQRRDLEIFSGTSGSFTGGTDANVGVGLAYRDVHRERYRRRGRELEANVTVAGGWTGSDFAYYRFDLGYARYVPLPGGIRNLNVRAVLGLSDGAPFGEETYSIGGGEILRGIASGRDEGNLLAVVNVEYLSAFFTRPSWRWVALADLGNVHPTGRFRPLAQNFRVGAGLRYKLRALSRTDLRLDVVWDPDEDKALTYFATSVTF